MTLTGMLTSRINARLPQVHAAYEMWPILLFRVGRYPADVGMNKSYKKLRMEVWLQWHAYVTSVSDLDSFIPIVIARLDSHSCDTKNVGFGLILVAQCRNDLRICNSRPRTIVCKVERLRINYLKSVYLEMFKWSDR
jgi:hypothetical protein